MKEAVHEAPNDEVPRTKSQPAAPATGIMNQLQASVGNRATTALVRSAEARPTPAVKTGTSGRTVSQTVIQRGNTDRFWREMKALETARRRNSPDPQLLRVSVSAGSYGGTIELNCQHPTAGPELLGSLSYLFAPLNATKVGGAANQPPAVAGLLITHKPVIIIHSFYSEYQNELKGIGSRLLAELVEIAQSHDSDHVFVYSGINPAVYEAFGFKLIEPKATVFTWWTTTSALRSRVTPNRGRPLFRESPT